MITVKNLYKRFGKNEVLKGIDLYLDEPGVYAILGPNGSGKTTLIKSILRMVLPDKGEITVRGKSVAKNVSYREHIGYLPQIANFPPNLSVKEILTMIRDLRGKDPRAEALLDLFGLTPYMGKKLNTLSGGTRQKVNIVLTLMFDSPLIILDEPTSGLDPVALLQLKQLIRKEREAGKIILITSHIMSFVEEMADEIIFLLEGQIHFKGSVQALKEKTHTLDFEKAIAKTLTVNEAYV